jgi:protein SCO1/2
MIRRPFQSAASLHGSAGWVWRALVVLFAAGAIASLAPRSAWAQPIDPAKGTDQFNAAVLPEERRGIDIREKLGEKIPLDLTLLDMTGKPVPIGSAFNDNGKPVVILMIYFRCPLMCPQTINGLVRSLAKIDWTMGEKYNVMLVSFDPTETPADAAVQHEVALAQYGREQTDAVKNGLRVFTDHQGNARRLSDALGFAYKYLPKSNQYSHLAATFVLTPEGVISRYLYGSKPRSDTLRMALLEASEGKIGTTFDRFTMWCMTFDESTGTYRLMASRVMKVGGLVSLVIVGAVLGAMLLVERRRRAAAVARAIASAGSLQSSPTEAARRGPASEVASS